MAVPRESWVILSDFNDSSVKDKALASGRTDPVTETYEAHLPTLETQQE